MKGSGRALGISFSQPQEQEPDGDSSGAEQKKGKGGKGGNLSLKGFLRQYTVAQVTVGHFQQACEAGLCSPMSTGFRLAKCLVDGGTADAVGTCFKTVTLAIKLLTKDRPEEDSDKKYMYQFVVLSEQEDQEKMSKVLVRFSGAARQCLRDGQQIFLHDATTAGLLNYLVKGGGSSFKLKVFQTNELPASFRVFSRCGPITAS